MKTAVLPLDPPPAKRALRVLYADDVPELRHLTQLSLARDDHIVECVDDGEEALAKISAAPDAYDVLITDHHMPRMTGLTLVQRLAEFPAFKGKIIIFSSSLSPEVDAAYRQHKVAHMLKKPLFPSVLRELLAKI